MSRTTTLRLTMLVAAILPSIRCATEGEGSPPGPPPVFVEVASVEPAADREVVELLGQLEALETVTLRAEIDGVIAEIPFTEGAAVTKDQLLFRLRDDRLQAEVREAEARRRLAADRYQRTNHLAEKGIASEAERTSVALELQAAEAAAEGSAARLEQTRIRAPFDGVIGHRSVSPGDRIDHETPLATISAIDTLALRLTIPERLIPLVEVGLRAEVTVATNPGEVFSAVIDFIAPTVEPEIRRILIKGKVPNPGRRLRPGSFANIRAEIPRTTPAVSIPDSALAADALGRFVWRVTPEGRAERVDIEIVDRRAGSVEVGGPLAPGDVVVSAGTNKVYPGALVQSPSAEPT